MAAPLKIGIAGLGTVGASVARLIERQRETELRAVDQREAFLRFERERRESRRFADFTAFEPTIAQHGFTFADHAQRHVCERREIA